MLHRYIHFPISDLSIFSFRKKLLGCSTLVLICLFPFSSVQSQSDSIQFIRNQYYLKVAQNDIDAAARIASTLVEKFREIKIDSSIVWVKKAMAHAKTSDNNKVMIKSLLDYRDFTFINHQLRYSMKLAKRADSLLQHFPNDTLSMLCLYRRAEGQEFYNNQDTAMTFYLACHEMAEKLNHNDMLTTLALKFGDISIVNEDYQVALEHYQNGLKYTESSDLNRWKLLANICKTQINFRAYFSEVDVSKACETVNSFFYDDNPFLNHSVSNYFNRLKTFCYLEYSSQKEINELKLTSLAKIRSNATDNAQWLKDMTLNFRIALKQKKLLEAGLYLEELHNYACGTNKAIDKIVYTLEAAYLEETKDYKRHVEVLKELHALQLDFEGEKRMKNFVNLEGKLEAKEKEYEVELLAAQARQHKIIVFSIGILALLSFLLFNNARRKNKLISAQKEQLESLNHTKDRIFAIIGHDLRKPAASFRGISKKVKYLIKKQDFETLDKYGQQIEQNALSLNKLTDNLLNWALTQRNVMPYNPSTVSLNDIAMDIQTIFNSSASEKNIQIINNVPGGMNVYADPNALSTILTNLVDNAIKYTPAGGQVRIEALQKNNEQLKIRVSDTGIGMEKIKLMTSFYSKKIKVKKEPPVRKVLVLDFTS